MKDVSKTLGLAAIGMALLSFDSSLSGFNCSIRRIRSCFPSLRDRVLARSPMVEFRKRSKDLVRFRWRPGSDRKDRWLAVGDVCSLADDTLRDLGDTVLLGTMATEIISSAALSSATIISSALISLVLLACRLAGRLSGRLSARLGARLGARLDARLSGRASARLSGRDGGARDGVRLKSIFVEPLNTGQIGSSGVCIAAEAGNADTGLFQ